MNRNEKLNDTCIFFYSKEDEEAIIKFYEDNGYTKGLSFRKRSNENVIGVYCGTFGYWWRGFIMTLIELPEDYNPLPTT
jgi:hypothetical protein